MPVYAEALVEYTDASVGLGGIEVVAFVLEHCGFTQDGKAVGKTSGDEELTVVIFSKFYCHMLAVGGRAFANIYGYIKDSTFDASHQFALGEGWGLEVEASHDAIGGHAFVVLHEVYLSYFLLEFSPREAFEEVATGITEHFGTDDDEAFYCGFDYFHCYVIGTRCVRVLTSQRL